MYMLKHILIGILASLIAILLIHQASFVLHWLATAHTMMARLLAKIFNGGEIGRLISHTLALFLVPLIFALIPTFIYWLITHRWFYYFPHVFWGFWLVLFAILAF